ncbi:MAG: thioredoxin family protein, partial [Kiritimatiellae bacterium]|nr:thioredoxin family protein [Kiritimatiellia bacterium]
MNKRTTLAALAITISFMVTASFAGKLWETDFEKASAKAKASHRYMLLDFSGSDWCGWCIKLDDEVFSKKDFKNYAKENLVCVMLDFPRKSLKKKLAKQN